MNLLIVGGSSFLGRNLSEFIVEESTEVSRAAATYRTDPAFRDWARARGIEPLRYDALQDRRDWRRFDACIYLAGNSDHGLAIQSPDEDLRLNALGLVRFLETYSGRLVYMSSGAVYYGRTGLVKPSVAVSPSFAYGISKLAAEHYVLAAEKAGELSSCMVVRLFYAFGKHDKPRRLIPQVVKSVLVDKRSSFRVRGTGTSFMDPVDARYVAEVLVAAALREEVSGVYDLCGGKNRTVVDIVRETAKALGVELEVPVDGHAEAFPVQFFGSPDPIVGVLGIAPPGSFESAVSSFAAWAHGAGT